MCPDTSTLGLRTMLMECNKRGKNYVIAYTSCTLNSAKANYPITHLETFAVVWGSKHFRDIILGYEVTMYTDHTAVTELFKGKNLMGKLA